MEAREDLRQLLLARFEVLLLDDLGVVFEDVRQLGRRQTLCPSGETKGVIKKGSLDAPPTPSPFPLPPFSPTKIQDGRFFRKVAS
jgi:hypothetical protein